MMKKMIGRSALLGVAALLVAACFSQEDFKAQYDTMIVVQFEPDQDYQWEEFEKTFYAEGKDTVSFNQNFSVGPVYHFASISDSDGFQGGLALARGKDADASEGRKPSRFAVYDKDGGYKGSRSYAVFHDTTATLMPEHLVQIAIPNTDSRCEAVGMFVHNVQAAYQAAKYGVGLADGPFNENDFLVLTVTGYKGSKVTGSKDIKLVNGTNAVVEWTEMDLSALGSVDALDFHLEASRADFPLYCCVDNMGYRYVEVY